MDHIARLIRPWATSDGPEGLDSMVMEARDRTANLAFFAAAAVVWVLVVLRLQGLLELPIALFIIAMVVVAEAVLSAER